jgi:hypothetical protein
MAIDPASSPVGGCSSHAAATKAGGTQDTPEAKAQASRLDPALHGGKDSIDLSSTSVALNAHAAGNSPPSGTLSADRLHDVLNRMMGGYYDQPSVQQAVAGAIVRAAGQDK